MDNVYMDRVLSIRERVGNLYDKIGLTTDYYTRASFANWLDSRKKSDRMVLDCISGYYRPTPLEVPDGGR